MAVFSVLLSACGKSEQVSPGAITDKQPARTSPADECGGCATGESCVGGQCVCTPSCEGRACEPDGCGGTCPCPEGLVRNGDGELVPKEDCHDSCAGAAATCGNICGESCGRCEEGQACDHGSCECKPSCDGTRCDDGCGGLCECGAGTVCNAKDSCVAPAACTDSCESTGRVCGEVCGQPCGACPDGESCVIGQCRAALNCADCSLKFSLVSKLVERGHIREVVLAIDYQPAPGEPAPRLADIRIDSNRALRLVEVEEGAALVEAGKKLFYDETTKQNFQRRPDGSIQLFAYGVSDVENLQAGQLATLRYELDELGPVSFWMTRRAEMFAPPAADQALQSTPYDQAVVVSR